MKKSLIRVFLFAFFLVAISNVAEAQKGKKRSSTKRGNTTVRKSTRGKTKATTVAPSAQDSTVAVAKAPEPAKVPDSLPIPKIKKSLRQDEAVETKDIRDRTPLAYEHLRG
jgi:erythromycin esterase-like protein